MWCAAGGAALGAERKRIIFAPGSCPFCALDNEVDLANIGAAGHVKTNPASSAAEPAAIDPCSSGGKSRMLAKYYWSRFDLFRVCRSFLEFILTVPEMPSSQCAVPLPRLRVRYMIFQQDISLSFANGL